MHRILFLRVLFFSFYSVMGQWVKPSRTINIPSVLCVFAYAVGVHKAWASSMPSNTFPIKKSTDWMLDFIYLPALLKRASIFILIYVHFEWWPFSVLIFWNSQRAYITFCNSHWELNQTQKEERKERRKINKYWNNRRFCTANTFNDSN